MRMELVKDSIMTLLCRRFGTTYMHGISLNADGRWNEYDFEFFM